MEKKEKGGKKGEKRGKKKKRKKISLKTKPPYIKKKKNQTVYH